MRAILALVGLAIVAAALHERRPAPRPPSILVEVPDPRLPPGDEYDLNGGK